MKITKDPDSGIYRVSFKTPNGTKSLSTGCTNKEDALRMVQDAEIKRLEQLSEARALTIKAVASMLPGKAISFDEASSKWQSWASQHLASRTVQTYQTIHTQYSTTSSKGGCQIYSMTSEEIGKFVNSVGGSLQRRSVVLFAFRSLFKWAFGEGYIANDPTINVKIRASEIPQNKRESKRTRPVTEQEFRKVVATIEPGTWPRVACFLGWYAGFRKMDTVLLEWSCVGESSIKVWTHKRGKIVIVPYENDELKSEIQKIPYLDERYCFPAEVSRLKQSMGRIEYHAMDNVFYNMGACFHGLRSAFATRCKEKGLSYDHIRLMLGHTNEAMTKRYIHSTESSAIDEQD